MVRYLVGTWLVYALEYLIIWSILDDFECTVDIWNLVLVEYDGEMMRSANVKLVKNRLREDLFIGSYYWR